MSFYMSRPITGLNLKSVARTVLELECIELYYQGPASPLTFNPMNPESRYSGMKIYAESPQSRYSGMATHD